MGRKKSIPVVNTDTNAKTGYAVAPAKCAEESVMEEIPREMSEIQQLADEFMASISESERERMRILARLLATIPIK